MPDTTVTVDTKTQKSFGWYVYGEVQPWRRWAGGIRYDHTQFLQDPGREWAIETYITFWPSEFLRFRLGYKHTERSDKSGVSSSQRWRVPATSTRSSSRPRSSSGAHPAHPF